MLDDVEQPARPGVSFDEIALLESGYTESNIAGLSAQVLNEKANSDPKDTPKMYSIDEYSYQINSQNDSSYKFKLAPSKTSSEYFEAYQHSGF